MIMPLSKQSRPEKGIRMMVVIFYELAGKDAVFYRNIIHVLFQTID